MKIFERKREREKKTERKERDTHVLTIIKIDGTPGFGKKNRSKM